MFLANSWIAVDGFMVMGGVSWCQLMLHMWREHHRAFALFCGLTLHKKALFPLLIPWKKRPKSLWKSKERLQSFLSHCGPSKSSMERSRSFEVIDGTLAKFRSHRRTHLNHDDVLIMKKTDQKRSWCDRVLAKLLTSLPPKTICSYWTATSFKTFLSPSFVNT
jgi:hypothetical protein